MFQLIKKNILQKSNIQDHEMDRFTKMLKTEYLNKNDFFVKQGEYAKKIAFVNKGLLLAYTLNDKGNRRVAQIALDGYWTTDLFSFYSGKPSLFTIQAQEDCELFVLNKSSFNDVCSSILGIEKFFRLLAEEAYVYALNRIVNAYDKNALERYQALLQEQANINQRVKQKDIASYLGIEPQSLSRIINSKL